MATTKGPLCHLLCLRFFFFCPIVKSYVIIIFKFVQNIALYLSINRKQGLCATVPGHKKNICWKHVESYILSERINSSQMPVLPQVHRADPCAPCCSLGSSAFPPGFSFFYINIFVCLLVFRHPQDIRRTARPGWSALLSSFLGLLAPLSFHLLPLRLEENLFTLPTILRHFQFSKEVGLFYSLVGKKM